MGEPQAGENEVPGSDFVFIYFIETYLYRIKIRAIARKLASLNVVSQGISVGYLPY